MVPLDGMVDPGASGVFLRERARDVEPPLPAVRRAEPSRVPPTFRAPIRAEPIPLPRPTSAPVPVFAVVGALTAGTLGSLLLAVVAIGSLWLRPEPARPLPPVAVVERTGGPDDEPEAPGLPQQPHRPVVREPIVAPPPPVARTPTHRTASIALAPGAPPFGSAQLTCEDGYRRRAPFADGRVTFDGIVTGAECRLGFLGGPVTTSFLLGPEPSWSCTFSGGTTRCAPG